MGLRLCQACRTPAWCTELEMSCIAPTSQHNKWLTNMPKQPYSVELVCVRWETSCALIAESSACPIFSEERCAKGGDYQQHQDPSEGSSLTKIVIYVCFKRFQKPTVKQTQPRRLLDSRSSVISCSPEIPLGLVFLGLWFFTTFVLRSPNRIWSLNHGAVYVLFVLYLRGFSSVAVARSSLHPTVLISNPWVWVELRDFLVPSAPGLKVPVGVGF